MINLVRLYWLPVLVLFVIFFDELFNCSAIVGGFSVDTGMKQYEAIVLAICGYSMMAHDILKGSIRIRERRILCFLFTMLLLYVLTPIFFNNPSDKHTAYLLVLGSECIPAAFIGIRFANSNSLNRINNIIPFMVIPISLLIGTIGLAAAMLGKTVGSNDYQEGGDTGLNYQTLSYFMAFCYTYSFYYVFYGNKKEGIINMVLKFAMAINMLFCVAICLMGGGRGAFVYMVVISLFLLLFYLKSSKKHRWHAIMIIVFFIIVSVYIVSSLGIMQSAGMERVSGNLTEDNARIELYKSAFDAFLSSPVVGNGVGSIWWTVGFYCHNMILDMLAETGLIGTFFLVNIIWHTFMKLYRLCKNDKTILFVFLVMTGALVNYMFSGYYIAAYKLFFVCSMVYCIPNNNYKLYNNGELKQV